MKRFKNCIFTAVGLAVIAAAVTLIIPISGQSKNNSGGGNPAGRNAIVSQPSNQPQPFQVNLSVPVGSQPGSAEFTVPAGKRLVIEYITADIQMISGKPFISITVSKDQASFTKRLIIAPQGTLSAGLGFGGVSRDIFGVSEPVRIYCESEATVRATGIRSGAGGSLGGTGSLLISGYLLDAESSNEPQ